MKYEFRAGAGVRLRSGTIRKSLEQDNGNLLIELARRTTVMQKLFCRVSIYLFLVLFLSYQPVSCAEQDPVQFITEYYTWYISQQNRMNAKNGKDICHYVSQETLEEIKIVPGRPGFDGTDYFLKLSDTPVDMNGVSIVVSPVETLGPDTLVAVVTIVYIDKFGHRFPDGVIVVVLKNIEGKLKIFKCIDAYPEA